MERVDDMFPELVNSEPPAVSEAEYNSYAASEAALAAYCGPVTCVNNYDAVKRGLLERSGIYCGGGIEYKDDGIGGQYSI